MALGEEALALGDYDSTPALLNNLAFDRRLRRQMAAVLGEVDLYATPTVASAAPTRLSITCVTSTIRSRWPMSPATASVPWPRACKRFWRKRWSKAW